MGVEGMSKSEIIEHRRTPGGRLLELAVGLSANQAMVYAFDYALYPFVIYRLGVLSGGAAMAVVSFLICLLSLWFYDWSKRDWLGIEAIKSMKTYEGESRFGRLFAGLMQRGDSVAVVVLSIKFDPFITMLYLRNGAFNGMSRRDWRIFLASWFIGNVYWIVACYMGISLVEWLWQAVGRAL
jgi:hypothetical protein